MSQALKILELDHGIGMVMDMVLMLQEQLLPLGTMEKELLVLAQVFISTL
jgi:hypothetical protein